jgi:hypothetical protein
MVLGLWTSVVLAETTAPVTEPSSEVTQTSGLSLGVFAGPLSVATDVRREVDKKGYLAGLGAAYDWYFSDVNVGVGLGFLAGEAKGSSEMTIGDQRLRISTLFGDAHVGYSVMPSLRLSLGAQSWMGEGSNFGSDDDKEKFKIFAYVEFEWIPESTKPYSFTLQYLRDVNVADRVVSALTVGVRYQLSR